MWDHMSMTTGKITLYSFLFFLLAVPFAWFVVLVPFTVANSFLRSLPERINTSVVNQFPQELKIVIKNGEVSLNQPNPYCLLLGNQPQVGIIFDLNTQPQLDAFEINSPYRRLCQSVAIVGQNYVMYNDEKQIKIQKIPTQVNLSINRQSISDFVVTYLPKITTFGVVGYLISPFIAIFFILAFFLLSNFWYSLVVTIVTKIFKTNPLVTTGKIYAVTLRFYLYIIIFQWVVVYYLLNYLFRLNVALSFPFLNTVIISLASMLYFNQQEKNLPPPPPPES